MTIATLTPAEARALIAQGARLIDIRDADEYAREHIPDAELVPLASLRGTPNLDTWRPADAVESAAAWKYALERNDGPSALIFSRQNLNHQNRDAGQIADINRGGYVLKDCAGTPKDKINLTGSWDLGNWNVSGVLNYRSDMKNILFEGKPCASKLADGTSAPNYETPQAVPPTLFA